MKPVFKWTLVVLLIIALLAALLLPAFGMFNRNWQFGYHGMMGPGAMHPGMMGGWWSLPFGWLGMGLMWLLPIALIVLAAIGVISLFRSSHRAAPQPPPGRICPHCSRPAQPDWVTCPYCSNPLSE